MTFGGVKSSFPTDADSNAEDHFMNLFVRINEMRKKNLLCDAVVVVGDGQRIPAHKVVLASSSRYFKSRFSSIPGNVVKVSDVAAAVVVKLVNYAYTLDLPLTREDAGLVEEGARTLGFLDAERLCKKWRSLVAENEFLVVTIRKNRLELKEKKWTKNKSKIRIVVEKKPTNQRTEIQSETQLKSEPQDPSTRVCVPRSETDFPRSPAPLTAVAPTVEASSDLAPSATAPAAGDESFPSNSVSPEVEPRDVDRSQRRRRRRQSGGDSDSSPTESKSEGVKTMEAWRKTPCQKRRILCGQCKRTITGSYYTFMAHINQVHGEKTNVCPVCDQRFTRKSYLKLHLANFHHGRNVNCEICEKNFLTKHTLRRHVKDIHESTEPHPCSHCEKTYRQLSSLRDHVKLVHQGSPKCVCPRCDKGFMSQKDMEQHLQHVHLGKKAPKSACPECGKIFTEYYLKRHVASVHRGVKVECQECGLRFSGRAVLARHREVVHEKRRFRCTLCLAEYRDFSAWQKHHQTRHIGVRFPCDVCDRVFKSQPALRRHAASAHEGVRFPCESCDKVFTQKAKLVSHERIVHLGRLPHICDLCAKGFSRPIFLKQHLLKAHHVIVDVVAKEAVDETPVEDEGGSESATEDGREVETSFKTESSTVEEEDAPSSSIHSDFAASGEAAQRPAVSAAGMRSSNAFIVSGVAIQADISSLIYHSDGKLDASLFQLS